MKDDNSAAPVRIVIKKKGHGGHHGGAWKVAYADFVTAMMALFIVLWIVGQSNPVKEAISMYFTNPNIFEGGAGILEGSPNMPEEGELITNPVTVEDPEARNEMEKLKAEGKRIEYLVASKPAFEKFKDKIQISVSKDGMKIELIENSRGLFFDVGKAEMKEDTINLLKLLAAELGKLPNRVIIEGHTDARPYVTLGYSNWELSVDRANSARKLLEENGLHKNQILAVRGYADRLLKHPDKPYESANRRVNIIVSMTKQDESLKGKGAMKKKLETMGKELLMEMHEKSM
jgi:chemotaxis protein MotB